MNKKFIADILKLKLSYFREKIKKKQSKNK